MYKAVIQFISNIKQSKKLDIAVGLSGGPDSIVLSHLLVRLKNDNIINSITAIHFNHNLRGNESDNDEVFVEKFCKEFNIVLILVSLDVTGFCNNNSIGTEEGARTLRYRNFLELKQKYNFDFIALGHNKNDKAETLLFNIFRGSGLKGIASIESKRDFYVRPILNFSRNDILNYIKVNNLDYRTDSSNNEIIYSRNKIRNIIIPQAEELLNRKIVNNLIKLSDISAEILDFTRDYIEKLVADLNFCQFFVGKGFVYLNKSKFLKNKTYIKREILNYLLKQLSFKYNIDYTKSNILLDYFQNNSNNSFDLLGFNFSVYKNTIIIGHTQKYLESCNIGSNIELEKKYSIGIADIEFSTQNKTNTQFYISKDLFDKGLSVEIIDRNLRFLPFGKKTEIKLSKVISDKKVPLFFRDKLLTFKYDNLNVFVFPIGTDKKIAVKNSENKIYINIYNDLLKKLYF